MSKNPTKTVANKTVVKLLIFVVMKSEDFGKLGEFDVLQ